MPRKPMKLDEEQIEQLASIGCIVEEIAAVMKCSKRTLERNYIEVINAGRQRMSASVKRAQFDVGVNEKHPTMLIWLGKQYCGQTDRSDQTIDHTHRYYIQGPAPTADADEWQQQHSPKHTSQRMQ